MATNYTEHYQLNQWEPGDKVLRTDFNADNLKIDAALKEEATAREALAEVVAGHTADIAERGNCKITYGTYTGIGTYGSENSNQLVFPFEPKLVVVQNISEAAPDAKTSDQLSRIMMILVRPLRTYYFNEGSAYATISWSGNTVSWYSTTPLLQMNLNGYTYLYVAFG